MPRTVGGNRSKPGLHQMVLENIDLPDFFASHFYIQLHFDGGSIQDF